MTASQFTKISSFPGNKNKLDDTVLISSSEEDDQEEKHPRQHQVSQQQQGRSSIQVNSLDQRTKSSHRRRGYLLDNSERRISGSTLDKFQQRRDERRSSVWESLGKFDGAQEILDGNEINSRLLKSNSKKTEPLMSSSLHTRTAKPATRVSKSIDLSSRSDHIPSPTKKQGSITPRRGGLVLHTGSSSALSEAKLRAAMLTTATTSGYTSDSYASDSFAGDARTKSQRRGGLVVPSGSSSSLSEARLRASISTTATTSGYTSDSYVSDTYASDARATNFKMKNRESQEGTASSRLSSTPRHSFANNNNDDDNSKVQPQQERYRRRGNITRYSFQQEDYDDKKDKNEVMSGDNEGASSSSNKYQPDCQQDLDSLQKRANMRNPPLSSSAAFSAGSTVPAQRTRAARRGSVTRFSLESHGTIVDYGGDIDDDDEDDDYTAQRNYGGDVPTKTSKRSPPLCSSAAGTAGSTISGKKTRAVRRGSVTRYSLDNQETVVDYGGDIDDNGCDDHHNKIDGIHDEDVPSTVSHRPLGRKFDRRRPVSLCASSTAAPHLAMAVASLVAAEPQASGEDAVNDSEQYYPPKPGDDNYSTNLENSGRFGRRSVSLSDDEEEEDDEDSDGDIPDGKKPAVPSAGPVQRSTIHKKPRAHPLEEDSTHVARSTAPLRKKKSLEVASGHSKKMTSYQAKDRDDAEDSISNDSSDDEFSGESAKVGKGNSNIVRAKKDSKLDSIILSPLASPTRAVSHSSGRRSSGGASDAEPMISNTKLLDTPSRFRQRRGSMVMLSPVATPFKATSPETQPKTETLTERKAMARVLEKRPSAQKPRGCLKKGENPMDRGWGGMSLPADKRVRFGSLVILEFPIILGE